jgi:hypothetical protein
MAKVSLSKQEMLLVQETCIEGELRCEQRAAAALARRDYAMAAYEIQVKEQYTQLKRRMLQELIPPPAEAAESPTAPAWLRDGIRDTMAVAGT